VSPWTAEFEREARALVDRVIVGDAASWRALMVRIAPVLEAWARGNSLLRRCRLAGDDDARAVMVAALERLAANDFENLKRFAANGELVAPAADLVSDVIRLGKLDTDEAPSSAEPGDTHLRAWLLRLLDFTARDHVRKRLGWGTQPGAPSKRDLHSDAMPLDEEGEPRARPPLTDRIVVAKLIEEILAYVATFPQAMRDALELWLDDLDPAEIAVRLELPDPARARALIRAGQARLRERFHGRSPILFA
jgi:DNA-directed RNA polymerase specialized sigma24 family protein